MAGMARIKAVRELAMTLRFSVEERRAIRAAAGKADLPMAQWIKRVLAEAAAESAKESGK